MTSSFQTTGSTKQGNPCRTVAVSREDVAEHQRLSGAEHTGSHRAEGALWAETAPVLCHPQTPQNKGMALEPPSRAPFCSTAPFPANWPFP